MRTFWLICDFLFCYAVGTVSGHEPSIWAAEVQCTRPGLHCNSKCDTVEMCVFDNGGSSLFVVEHCGDLHCHSPPGECNANPLDASCTFEFACQNEGKFPHPYDCTKYCTCDSELKSSCLTCDQLGTAYNPTSGSCDADLDYHGCTDNPVPLCQVAAGIYPVAEDPSIYYICLPDPSGNLQPHFIKCPDGNEFDVDTKQCSTFKCSKPGFFPDPKDCTYYYFCSPELIPFHYKCPNGYIFNSTVGQCTEGTNCPNPLTCDKVGIFTDEEDCTMYYVCTPDHIKVHVKCPGNTHFDSVTLTCDVGPCEDSVTTTSLPTSTLPRCTSSGIFPDPYDCTKYYICLDDGTQIPQTCSSGHFDADERMCVPGPCPDDSTTTTIGTTTLPLCSIPGIFPDPYDCTKYYICLDDGTQIPQTCSSGHFDADERMCVPGPCPDDSTTTTIGTTTLPLCSIPGIFPDPYDCTKYYICLEDGTQIPQTCSTGHFDAEERTCLPGPCPTQTDPTTTTTEATTSTPITECTTPGYYPNPQNCTTYFICSDDLTLNEVPCPKGYHFDTIIGICVEGPCENLTSQTSFMCALLGVFIDSVDCTSFVPNTS